MLMGTGGKLGGRDAMERRRETLKATLQLCLGPGDSKERLDQFNSNEAIVWAYENSHNYSGSRSRAGSCVIPTALLVMTDPEHEFTVRVSDSLAAYESYGGTILGENAYLDGACYGEIRAWASELLTQLPSLKQFGLLGVYCLLELDASPSI